MPDSPLALYLQSVAANVRRLRLRRGLTQEALAERAGLDLSYEQRVERGATNLSMGVLVALARALGVPPGLLLRKARLAPLRRGRPRKGPRTAAR
jgi:transcriptional regulator with XRE-family HTH domain